MIEMKLVESGFLTRYPCHVCGGCTEKEPILCEAEIDGVTLRVCETCLKAGQEEIDNRLKKHIQKLKDYADDLTRLIGQLKVPTYAEYEAAAEAHAKAFEEQYSAEIAAEIAARNEARMAMSEDDDSIIPF
jgi:hypothetical protein